MRSALFACALLGCNALTGVDDYTVRTDAAVDAEAGTDAGGAGHLVFVSSETIAADFGGDGQGADALCQRLADKGGRKGTFVALVARQPKAMTDVRAKLDALHGFVRPDGGYLADTIADVFAGRLHKPILQDENGDALAFPAQVWSGLSTAGAPTKHCSFWSTTAKAAEATVGDPTGGLSSTFDIYSGLGDPCDTPWHVYCAQTDGGDRAPPAPVVGKLVFLTAKAMSAPDVATADAKCQADADDTRTDGRRFKALVARDGVAAAGIILATATYVRPSGALVGTGADLASGTIATGLWERSDTSYPTLAIEAFAFTGASSPTEVGAAAGTCTNWSGTTAAPKIGDPRAGAIGFFRHPFVNRPGDTPLVTCADRGFVYCVEQ